MRLLFENWRAFLQEEDLLEEGLWDTVKSDVSAVFMGIKPDATIGYLLDKLRSTSAIKNLKGDNLVNFLQSRGRAKEHCHTTTIRRDKSRR